MLMVYSAGCEGQTDRRQAVRQGRLKETPGHPLLPEKIPPPPLTWRRKSLCRRLRLGGSGSCLQSRSGERVPLGPNTFRSLKHSVSIIWGGRVTGGDRREQPQQHCRRAGPPPGAPRPQYLVLPGDGDAAGGELGVEIVVCLVQVDALHRRELLNVQHVLAINRPGLREPESRQWGGAGLTPCSGRPPQPCPLRRAQRRVP